MTTKWVENPEWDKTPTNPGFWTLDLPSMKQEENPIVCALYLAGEEPYWLHKDGTKEIIPEKDRLF